MGTGLQALVDAVVASRKARLAELQAQCAEPDAISIKGIVMLNPRSSWWNPAALSGNRELLRLSCPVGIFSFIKRFVFPRDRIRRLSKIQSVFIGGVRIEHAVDSAPEFIAFFPAFPWGPGFSKLETDLARLDYGVD